MENIITNNVPILLEENAMKAIGSLGFLRFHRVEGSKHFIFCTLVNVRAKSSKLFFLSKFCFYPSYSIMTRRLTKCVKLNKLMLTGSFINHKSTLQEQTPTSNIA